MERSLEGKSVAITGAAKGIGRAIAERLLADGANVMIGDIDLSAGQRTIQELEKFSGRVGVVKTDVSEVDASTRLVDACVCRFGRLDSFIANAGVISLSPFLEIGAEEWNRVMNVNARGTLFGIQAAARQMLCQSRYREGPRGKIVCISSIAARYGAGEMAPFMPHYRASKAAVVSLVQSAAAAFAPEITVNALCPGLVDTDMWKTIGAHWANITKTKVGSAWKQRTAQIPMGRPQQGTDVAGACAFLVGPDSNYITGQSINIDGGLNMN